MSRIYKVELCMKYDTCRRCPRNKECEAEYKKQEEKHNAAKNKNTNNKNLG